MIYQEESSFFRDNEIYYDLNLLFVIASNKNTNIVYIKDLEWQLVNKLDDTRVLKSDYTIPILYTKYLDNKLSLIDGEHRVTKAKQEGCAAIYGKFISREEMLRAAITYSPAFS